MQATIFPHDAEGVSLWFSGKRLLTDGTSENSVAAKFAHSVSPLKNSPAGRARNLHPS